ncbi:MAG: hypothetical protein MUF55_01470 [Hydrogenophaga sp.]|nr:hypothetical protein [Hydrogenophaga sp.]
MVRGATVIAAFAALAAAARIGQDVAIAGRYGTGPQVDAYYFSLALVSWPAAFLLAMLTLLIPPAEAVLRQRGEQAVRQWRSELLGWTLAAAALLLPLAWWALDGLLGHDGLGLSGAAADVASTMLPYIVITVPVGILVAIASCWFIASGWRSLSLLEALPPLTLLSLLALSQSSFAVLFWGTALALVVQLLAMGVVLLRARMLPVPRWSLRSPEWPGFARASLALVGGQMLFALTPLVDPFFAARLGEGQVATLSYANRLVLGLLSLLGLALQRAAMPLLSQLAAAQPAEAWRTVLRWSLMAALAGSGIGALLALTADPLVAFLFERGQFGADDRQSVARLFAYGMLQLPLYLVGLVMVTALASARAVGLLAAVTGVSLVTKFAASALLAPALGLLGLSLASALMYLATAVAAGIALRRHLNRTTS